MTIKELKMTNGYDFECNMSEEYKNYDVHDEWGCAFLWLREFIGVEYNFCVDTNFKNNEFYSACAIYKMEFNVKSNYAETDYNTFIPYDVDFNNPNWKEELENAMCKALITFFDL